MHVRTAWWFNLVLASSSYYIAQLLDAAMMVVAVLAMITAVVRLNALNKKYTVQPVAQPTITVATHYSLLRSRYSQ